MPLSDWLRFAEKINRRTQLIEKTTTELQLLERPMGMFPDNVWMIIFNFVMGNQRENGRKIKSGISGIVQFRSASRGMRGVVNLFIKSFFERSSFSVFDSHHRYLYGPRLQETQFQITKLYGLNYYHIDLNLWLDFQRRFYSDTVVNHVNALPGVTTLVMSYIPGVNLPLDFLIRPFNDLASQRHVMPHITSLELNNVPLKSGGFRDLIGCLINLTELRLKHSPTLTSSVFTIIEKNTSLALTTLRIESAIISKQDCVNFVNTPTGQRIEHFNYEMLL
jgi:hypothetical protein